MRAFFTAMNLAAQKVTFIIRKQLYKNSYNGNKCENWNRKTALKRKHCLHLIEKETTATHINYRSTNLVAWSSHLSKDKPLLSKLRSYVVAGKYTMPSDIECVVDHAKWWWIIRKDVQLGASHESEMHSHPKNKRTNITNPQRFCCLSDSYVRRTNTCISIE